MKKILMTVLFLLATGQVLAQPAPEPPESDVMMGQYLVFQMPEVGLVEGFNVYWGPVGQETDELSQGPLDMSPGVVLRSPDSPAVYEWDMLQPQIDQDGNPIDGTTMFQAGQEYCFEVTSFKTVTTTTNPQGKVYESKRSNRVCAKVTPKPLPPTDLKVDD